MLFFFNDTATTEIYTLSLHDALPISPLRAACPASARNRGTSSTGMSSMKKLGALAGMVVRIWPARLVSITARSEEHTSELQSRQYLVCRLLLEKKKPTRHRNRLKQLR